MFTDGLTNLSTTNELHTSFSLTPGSGQVALSRLYGVQTQVLDCLDYTNLTPNRSYGSLPRRPELQAPGIRLRHPRRHQQRPQRPIDGRDQ